MSEEIIDAAEKAAKNAKRCLVMTMLAVAVAIAVLAIDNSIKRSIITEAQKAQGILNQVQFLAEEVKNGTQAAGETGSPSGPGLDGGNDVVHDAAAGEVLDQAENGAKPAPRKRPARTARGTSGDG